MPATALDALVHAHVAFALRDRAVIKVYSQESDQLPDDDRRRLRRKQHVYAAIWSDVVAELTSTRPRKRPPPPSTRCSG